MKKAKKQSFFDFDRRLFPQKAKAYHNEVRQETSDLIDVYSRAARTYLLCERTAKIIMTGKGWLSPIHQETDFESLGYHLENFWLRAFSYREKICQLINASLDLQFSEKASLFNKLTEDCMVRKSSVKKDLERFNKDKVLHEILVKRKLLTHRIYYDTAVSGYDRNFRPISKKSLTKKTWLETMRKEIKLCERFIEKAMVLNDSIMAKLVKFKKENRK